MFTEAGHHARIYDLHHACAAYAVMADKSFMHVRLLSLLTDMGMSRAQGVHSDACAKFRQIEQ